MTTQEKLRRAQKGYSHNVEVLAKSDLSPATCEFFEDSAADWLKDINRLTRRLAKEVA